jgi:hypothetical protein
MPARTPQGGLLLLDACCLINLFASGRIEAVLGLLPYRFATSELVADREVLSIRGAPRTSGEQERVALTPRDFERSGDLEILPVTSEREQAQFVRFATELDDGEASVCALAVVHGGGVATDDRKALRILGRVGAEVPALWTIQTPELLFEWARRSGAAAPEIRDALRAIADRGSFYPRAGVPRYDWWVRSLR